LFDHLPGAGRFEAAVSSMLRKRSTIVRADNKSSATVFMMLFPFEIPGDRSPGNSRARTSQSHTGWPRDNKVGTAIPKATSIQNFRRSKSGHSLNEIERAGPKHHRHLASCRARSIVHAT